MEGPTEGEEGDGADLGEEEQARAEAFLHIVIVHIPSCNRLIAATARAKRWQNH